MRKGILVTVGFILATAFTASARDGGVIGFIECPFGMVEGGPSLCIQEVATGEKRKQYHYTDRRATENKLYVEAQAECRAYGGHVCTYDEMWEAWDVIKHDLDRQEMIGNIVLDDHHLCVNNPNDRNNFEGHCHKHFRYRYRCCMTALPGL